MSIRIHGKRGSVAETARMSECSLCLLMRRERINFRHVGDVGGGGGRRRYGPLTFTTRRHALMEIWFCFPVTEVERSVGAAPGATGAAAGGSRGLSPSPAPSSPSTPVATSPSASTSSASSSPSPSSSASVLVAGLDKSVLQVSWLFFSCVREARRGNGITYCKVITRGEIKFKQNKIYSTFYYFLFSAHISLKVLFLFTFDISIF